MLTTSRGQALPRSVGLETHSSSNIAKLTPPSSPSPMGGSCYKVTLARLRGALLQARVRPLRQGTQRGWEFGGSGRRVAPASNYGYPKEGWRDWKSSISLVAVSVPSRRVRWMPEPTWSSGMD